MITFTFVLSLISGRGLFSDYHGHAWNSLLCIDRVRNTSVTFHCFIYHGLVTSILDRYTTDCGEYMILTKVVPDMDGRSSLPVWGRRASSPGKFLKLRSSEMGLLAFCGQARVLYNFFLFRGVDRTALPPPLDPPTQIPEGAYGPLNFISSIPTFFKPRKWTLAFGCVMTHGMGHFSLLGNEKSPESCLM